MLYEEKVYEGLSIKLVVQDGEYKGSYRTRIEEMGKSAITIGVPIVQNQFISLREGTELEVIFNDGVTAFSFSTKILKRFSNPIPSFHIGYPSKIKKIQRRKFVRVPLFCPLKYHVITEKEDSEEKPGSIMDLSGGGLLFESQENLPPQTLIAIETKIGTNEIEIPGLVIRSEKEDEKNVYRISVQFQDISERTRDKIIRYVFQIQREMRKKGLI